MNLLDLLHIPDQFLPLADQFCRWKLIEGIFYFLFFFDDFAIFFERPLIFSLRLDYIIDKFPNFIFILGFCNSVLLGSYCCPLKTGLGAYNKLTYCNYCCPPRLGLQECNKLTYCSPPTGLQTSKFNRRVLQIHIKL